MKFPRVVATLAVLLSCTLLRADIVETTQETAHVAIPLDGDELTDISTRGLVANRHGTSTPPGGGENAPTIPEPASALLLGMSLVGAAMLSRRRAAQV